MPPPPTGETPVSADEFGDRLIALCVLSGLRSMPRRQRDRQILMKSIVLTLDPDESYSEIEINNALKYWLADIGRRIRTDHVNLRRLLVDEGYLERDRHGSVYTVASSGAVVDWFGSDVAGLDVYPIIGEGVKAQQEKKEQYLQSQQD